MIMPGPPEPEKTIGIVKAFKKLLNLISHSLKKSNIEVASKVLAITVPTSRRKNLVNEEGFLNESQVWDEDVAHIIAKNEGIDELDEEKMDIIKYMRKHYAKHGSFPMLGKICKSVGASPKIV